MSQRTQQFGELIRHQLSRIIVEEIELPENTLVTITRVDVAPDLKMATVSITIFPDGKRGTILEILKKNNSALRYSLAQEINTRITPKLYFKIDEKETYGNEIDKLLYEVKQHDKD